MNDLKRPGVIDTSKSQAIGELKTSVCSTWPVRVTDKRRKANQETSFQDKSLYRHAVFTIQKEQSY